MRSPAGEPAGKERIAYRQEVCRERLSRQKAKRDSATEVSKRRRIAKAPVADNEESEDALENSPDEALVRNWLDRLRLGIVLIIKDFR